jgi:hypothetical protein
LHRLIAPALPGAFRYSITSNGAAEQRNYKGCLDLLSAEGKQPRQSRGVPMALRLWGQAWYGPMAAGFEVRMEEDVR